MPIRYEQSVAVFDGAATVEEAGDLAAWLMVVPARGVDLAACTVMHAAVLQCMMALRPKVVSAPHSETLARWLAPVLSLPAAASEPAPASKPARRRRKTPAPRRTARREAISA